MNLTGLGVLPELQEMEASTETQEPADQRERWLLLSISSFGRTAIHALGMEALRNSICPSRVRASRHGCG